MLTDLDFERFAAWLHRQPVYAVFTGERHCAMCPVATWLQVETGRLHEVDGTHYYPTPLRAGDREPLSPAFKKFVRMYDEDKQFTCRSARAVLEQMGHPPPPELEP